jgi:hypothetical protein
VQLVAIIAICIIAGCSAYLAFDLSRFKHIVLRNHFAGSHEDRLFEPAAPAAPFIGPSPTPLQTAAAESSPLSNVTETERIAKEQENSGTPASETVKPPAIPLSAGSHEDRVLEPAAPAAPLGGPSPAPLQTAAAESSPLDNVTETERIAKDHQNSGTPVPKTSEPAAIPQIAGSHDDRVLEPAVPAALLSGPSPAPLQTPAAESSPLDNVTGTQRIANKPESNEMPAQKTREPPAIQQFAGSHEDRVLKAPSIPTGNITLAESQERTRKAREISATRSSASLYSGIPTPPPKFPPAYQRHEAEASVPPPPAETPAPLKSPTKERGGGTEIAQDLRRFAADYLRTDENENVEAQARYYAGSVHFYREGDLSWARIAAATQRYHRNSRQRRYVLSPASIRGPVDGGFWVVDQPFTWMKSDGIRTHTGRSVLRMRVIPVGRGNFKITSVEQVGQ